LILQRKLVEIDLSSENISERLITLACGHIFTVKTLDGHCNMSEYYQIDSMGVFTATKSAPVNYQNPPSCPTCHGPITALRYGRVTRRADLDILEQNMTSTLSSALEETSPQIEHIFAKLGSAKAEAKKIAASNRPTFEHLGKKRMSRFGKETEPLPHYMIHQGGMTTIHGFSSDESKAWAKVVCDLLRQYKKVGDIARTRGPHVEAYEATLATLYRLELAAITSDPERACDKPESMAIRAVNRKIGQPPREADTRFRIEAFFLSLELRFTLAEVAQSRIEGLNTGAQDEDVTTHVRLWQSYVSFLYESCIRDAEKALHLAQKSTSLRLAARAGIHILRGKLEQFRFEILTEQDLLAREGPLDGTYLKELSVKAQKEATTTAVQVRTLEATYIRNLPATDMDEQKAERAWFCQNCRGRGETYVEEYRKLAVHFLLVESDYTPLPLQEEVDIVKAFGFCKSN
jgi:hypothetical protein